MYFKIYRSELWISSWTNSTLHNRILLLLLSTNTSLHCYFLLYPPYHIIFYIFNILRMNFWEMRIYTSIILILIFCIKFFTFTFTLVCVCPFLLHIMYIFLIYIFISPNLTLYFLCIDTENLLCAIFTKLKCIFCIYIKFPFFFISYFLMLCAFLY